MTVDQIIEKYNIRIATQTQDEYRCFCPIHEESNPSFSINKKTGNWICFSGCGAGNLISLTMKINKCGYQEAKKMLYGDDNLLRYEEVHNNCDTVKLPSVVALPEFFTNIKDKDNCPAYVLNRMKLATAIEFGIGFCDEGYFQNRIIVPIVQNKTAVGFVARDYSGNAEKKYLFPKGFKSRDYIFNADNISSSEVILVEGPFDAISMWEKGFRNTGCIFGIDISVRQVDIMIKKKIDSVVLCFDNDEGAKKNFGLLAAKQIAQRFKYYFKNISIMKLPGSRDPDECSQIELSLAYRSRKKIMSESRMQVDFSS